MRRSNVVHSLLVSLALLEAGAIQGIRGQDASVLAGFGGVRWALQWLEAESRTSKSSRADRPTPMSGPPLGKRSCLATTESLGNRSSTKPRISVLGT